MPFRHNPCYELVCEWLRGNAMARNPVQLQKGGVVRQRNAAYKPEGDVPIDVSSPNRTAAIEW